MSKWQKLKVWIDAERDGIAKAGNVGAHEIHRACVLGDLKRVMQNIESEVYCEALAAAGY